MGKKAVLLLLLSGLAILSAVHDAYSSESFEIVYDNLSVKKNTALHVKEYWKGIAGKEVQWSGTVFDVKGGRGKAEIRIANKNRPLAKGFNINISVFDVEKAARLKKGQQVRFRGYLHNYDSGRHSGVRIFLRDGEIL